MISKTEKSCPTRKLDAVNVEDYEKITDVTGALSNKTRLAMLSVILKYGEVCTCELESSLDFAQPTITSHLHRLYSAGILKKRENWRYTYYSISERYSNLIQEILSLNK